MEIETWVGQDSELVVKQWFDTNLERVAVKNPISNHIDEIFDFQIPESVFFDLSVWAFLILIELLEEANMPVKPLLRIPLKQIAKEITRAVPKSKKEIEAQLTREPPSLYLLDWNIGKLGMPSEEYCRLLPFELSAKYSTRLYVYYREFRFASGIEYDEEFYRAIVAEYFPLGLDMK